MFSERKNAHLHAQNSIFLIIMGEKAFWKYHTSWV